MPCSSASVSSSQSYKRQKGFVVTHGDQLIARARHIGCDVIQEYVNKGQKDQRNAGDAEKIPGKRFKAASTDGRGPYPLGIRIQITPYV